MFLGNLELGHLNIFLLNELFLSGTLSLYGTIFGVLGSLTLSLYSIYTKQVLPHVNQEIWLLSYYNNAYSILLFLPLIIFSGELSTIANFKHLTDSVFWMQMLGSGVCGFAIGYVTSLQIKVCTYMNEFLFISKV